jgi:branched-chain amino acid transport system ATP-binding protein
MQTLGGVGESQISQDSKTGPLLTVDGITVQFGGINAVDDVSFTVEGGQVVGLIGPNGAGKTTLLDVLSGLRSPTRGHVLLEDRDITKRSATELSRYGIRRTFQRHQTFGWLTVEENLMVPLEWRGRTMNLIADLLDLPFRRRAEQSHRRRADDVIDLCGLTEVRDRSAASLPIGQIRLLEFARAIVEKPLLLLLDEPTSGLGRVETERLGPVIRDVTADGLCGVLLVEHDVEFVMGLSDRIIVMAQGRVIADGIPSVIREDPVVRKAYLGHG